MDRRTVLRAAAVLSAAAVAGCTSEDATSPPPRRTTTSPPRGSPSSPPPSSASPSGPSASNPSPSAPPPSAWRALAGALSGDLVRPGDAGYGQAKELFDPRFDAAHPVAVVEAADADDVRAALGFARRWGFGVRPKAGGHSYVGASTGTGVLVVSVASMTDVSYDPGSRTATVGAGARLYPVHEALASYGRTFPTGTCPTVGAAGLTLGGGIGVASRQYGLTCDALTAAQVVTADGVLRTASDADNPDLLWALRGGGGGNFGVVTSLTYATYPTTSTGFFLQTFPWSSAARVLRGWAARVTAAPRSTWANLHLEAGSDGSAQARVVGVCAPGAEQAEASAMEAAIGVGALDTSVFTKSYLDGVQFLGGGTTSPRQGWVAGSDVVRRMTASLAAGLARVIAERAASGRAGVAILDPLTGAVQDRAVPATAYPWRRHLCDVQWYLSMPDHPSAAELREGYGWVASAHRAVARGSAGGYVNYLEPRRAVASYYGPNFARLQGVRRSVDPGGLFSTPYTIPI